MKPELEKLCEDFIANRDVVKKTFRWDNASCYPVCANVLCAYGITADPDRLKECRDVVKKHTRPFSKFRGQVKPILSCMLAHGEDPDARMDLANDYYRLLKRKFRKSEYLVLAAFLAADLADRSLTEETAARGKEIFRLMNRNHRILTNKTDSVSAVLMAFSGKTDNELIDDMEAYYKVLKTRFSGSAAQPAAQVLSMVSGTPEEKAQRVIELYDALQEAGVNYGRSAEIAPLAALSVSGIPVSALVEEIKDADAFLEEKQESKKDEEKKDRALQAAMIVSDQYANTEYVNTTVMTGALDIMIAKKRSVLASIAWQLVQFLFEVLAGISKSDDKTEKVPEGSNESAEQSGKE